MTYNDAYQFRATLEDTISFQLQLLDKLDELIEGNRCIRDAEERKKLFKLLGTSTFGIGIIPVKLHFEQSRKLIFIPNLEQFVGNLFYYNKNTVDKTFWFPLLGKDHFLVEIKELWILIRIHLLKVFPEAKQNAIRMSKEQRTPSDSSESMGYAEALKD